MNRGRLRYNMLKITLLTLALSTWVFCSFIYATRPPESASESASDAFTNLVRLPASLPAQIPGISEITALPQKFIFAPQEAMSEPIEMKSLKIGCWESVEGSKLATRAQWVRLTGKVCQGRQNPQDNVVVRNLTNGYVATVFPASADRLTTDFIPLQAGKNDILISISQEPGSTVENRLSLSRE